MTKIKIDWAKVDVAKGFFSVALIFFAILVCSKPIFYVEKSYLSAAKCVSYESFLFFLEEYPARLGPLYPMLQAVISALTHFDIPQVRLLNFFLLIGSFLGFFVACRVNSNKRKIAATLGIMSVPGVWVASSLASGDMTAFFFMSLALAFFFKFQNENSRIGTWIVGMVFWEMALFSCQFYIFLTPALFILIKGEKKKIIACCLMVVVSALVPLALYYYWGGLYSPKIQKIFSLSNPHFMSMQQVVFAGAYAAVCSYLCAPGKLKITNQDWLLLVAATLGNLFFLKYSIIPIETFSKLFFGNNDRVLGFWGIICGALFVFLAMRFFLGGSLSLMKKMDDKWNAFLKLSSLIVTFVIGYSSASFSVRYIMPVVPFLFFLNVDTREFSFKATLTGGIGSVVGFIALWSYLFR